MTTATGQAVHAGAASSSGAAKVARAGALKVPQITLVFWIIKLLTTGGGEATNDFFAGSHLWVAGVIGAIGLAVALNIQFRSPRYSASAYWFAVAMVAVFGTFLADLFNPPAGGYFNVPLPVTTVVIAVCTAACFSLWYWKEGTLSIHEINTPRREGFYWFTILCTFALGTAAGDWTAFYLNLGFATSILYFAIAMCVPIVLWKLGLNPIITFWVAYVLTRPLGASIADKFSKPAFLGGWNLGDDRVAAIAVAVIVGLVAWVAATKLDNPDRHQRTPIADPA